jgi:hypothetical protein
VAVGFRAATNTGAAASVTSRAVNVPAGVASGDVAVCFLGLWDSSGAGGTPTVTPPSGFAQAYTFSSGDGKAKNSIWWKRLTGADSGTYSWSLSIACFTTVDCVAFTGVVSSGDPIGSLTTSAVGTFGSITSLNLTLAAGDAALWCVYNDSSGAHTPATGFTEVSDVDSASAAYLLSGAGGSTTASGGSIGSSSPAGAAMVGLVADGAVAGHPTILRSHSVPGMPGAALLGRR